MAWGRILEGTDLGEMTVLLSLVKALSLGVETPAVPEALVSWEPQLGTAAPGSLLGCSDSPWRPHSAGAQ